jgi:hypothetical protein
MVRPLRVCVEVVTPAAERFVTDRALAVAAANYPRERGFEVGLVEGYDDPSGVGFRVVRALDPQEVA